MANAPAQSLADQAAREKNLADQATRDKSLK
jgi:hypothetical protein